ncbi:hypothetical protein [Nocardia sp. NPDC059691]|uniref:hypothetical protein n=1 Tax=Nocardia sp. NPDC059691 TaxID=3346908 RepID=UPI0036A2BD97
MDAIEATITAGLIGTGTVGQLHAACGSGQTLVVAECARWLVAPGGVAVAVVPLIALTDTLSVGSGRSVAIAVCSDDTVAADSAGHAANVDTTVSTNVPTLTECDSAAVVTASWC